METLSVPSDDEAIRDKSAAIMRNKDDYEGLDVFGTEAVDSVCGVDILDPFYRPDVKRIISLWSILLLEVTSVLTLGFFGCFRHLKGANLDLSRNLWNEDLLWTSLVIFMLTCVAITCGLSALASHANLYSHAKVLGFRRVFRWCFALHAAAAVFTLIVALKLTFTDLVEPQCGVFLTTSKNPPDSVVDTSGLKRTKNIRVYRRDWNILSPAASDSPPRLDAAFMQTISVNAEVPVSVDKARKTEAASPRGVTAEATNFLLPGQRLAKYSPVLMDFLHEESGRSRKNVDFIAETHADSYWHQRKSPRKTTFRSEEHWKAKKHISPLALLRIASSQRAKQKLSPASTVFLERGRENYSGARASLFKCPHAHGGTSPLSYRNESSILATVKTSEPCSQSRGETVEQSLVPSAAELSVLPGSREHAFWQKHRTAALFPRPRNHAFASNWENEAGAQLTRAFTAVSSPYGIPARTLENDGNGNIPVVPTAALPLEGCNKRSVVKIENRSSRGDEHTPQAAVSLLLEGADVESRDEEAERAGPEMKNELRPVRESRIYRVMLYLVVSLDYSLALLQVVCFMYTWRLATKIGTMFGLRILKLPF